MNKIEFVRDRIFHLVIDKNCKADAYAQLGDYKLRFKDIKEIAGHDDSLPFQGRLFVGATQVAFCHNDGWGGDAEVEEEGTTKAQELLDKVMPLLVAEYVEFRGTKYHYRSLADFSDSLACFTLECKEIVGYMRKNAKDKVVGIKQEGAFRTGYIRIFSEHAKYTLASKNYPQPYEGTPLANAVKRAVKRLEDDGYVVWTGNIDMII